MKRLMIWFLRRFPSRWMLEALDVHWRKDGISLVNPKSMVWVARGGVPLLYLDVVGPQHCRATVLLSEKLTHVEFLAPQGMAMAHREFSKG